MHEGNQPSSHSCLFSHKGVKGPHKEIPQAISKMRFFCLSFSLSSFDHQVERKKGNHSDGPRFLEDCRLCECRFPTPRQGREPQRYLLSALYHYPYNILPAIFVSPLSAIFRSKYDIFFAMLVFFERRKIMV